MVVGSALGSWKGFTVEVVGCASTGKIARAGGPSLATTWLNEAGILVEFAMYAR